MPGHPVRTRARFRISPGNSPSRIASLPPASPQIIHWQDLRIATYSLDPLCSGMWQPATEKHFPLVQKLCTVRLPCGSLRKTAEEMAGTPWCSERGGVLVTSEGEGTLSC